MPLYLVQHAKSRPKETDPEQGLTDQGKIDAQQVAIKARELGLTVSRIVHSGKRRARQTAEAIASLLTPGRTPEVLSGLNPTDDVRAFAATLSAGEDLMVIGHLPFMERLAAYLLTGSEDRPLIRFTNSGIVCLEYDAGLAAWVIRWAMTPDMAR